MQPNKSWLTVGCLLLLSCLCFALDEDIHCELGDVTSDTSGNTTAHSITVRCGEDSIIGFSLTERAGYYQLILEHSGVEWLDVEKEGENLFIAIEGRRFNVRDGLQQGEDENLVKLFQQEGFRYFTESVQIIHDELELKGWESPVVMLLYNLALRVDRIERVQKVSTGRASLSEAAEGGLERATPAPTPDPDYDWIDPRTWDYHGLRPKKSCEYNGWRTRWPYFTLKKSECTGVCGPGCKTCWMFVCGDCCYHLGCQRHDKFCGDQGYTSKDCSSFRGVLWDTLTDTTGDC